MIIYNKLLSVLLYFSLPISPTYYIPRSQIPSILSSKTISASSNCPADFENFAQLMLNDLPSYANRVQQRARDIDRDPSSYIVVAGRPEFEPLSLNQQGNTEPESDSEIKQLFFTTLERQYVATKVVEVQNYYWLFVTPTENGWRLVTIFSRFGSSNAQVAPTPPRETSNGIIGQAVRLWLRDCHAGAIRNLGR